jgi:hypothetical protein
MTTLNNWAGTLHFTPATVLRPPHGAPFPRSDVRAALDRGQTVRVLGSIYSFSDCVIDDGLVVLPPPSSPSDVALATRPGQHGLTPAAGLPFLNPDVAWAGAEPAGYAWVPWTCVVDDLCKACRPLGLSPYTLGGSTGQHVIGAVSTSTHGADFNEFPLPEYVEAVQVFTGDADVWIEREKPGGALTVDALVATWMGAPGRLFRSNAALNAGLVSFGAGGAIVGALVRLRKNEEMIERTIESLPWAVVRGALLDGSIFTAPPGEAQSPGGVYRYVEVLLNAYGPAPTAFLCARNERPWLGQAVNTPHRPSPNVVQFLRLAGAGRPDRAGALAELLKGSRLNGGWYRFLDVLDVGIPSSQPVYSFEPAWDVTSTVAGNVPAYVAFLDRAIEVIRGQGEAPFLGTLSLRFTRGTSAYLGMQSTDAPYDRRFAHIEIGALQDILNGSRALPAPASEFLTAVLSDPSAQTARLHWGQGSFPPMLFDARRFPNLPAWQMNLRALLGPRAAQFQTPFTQAAHATL